MTLRIEFSYQNTSSKNRCTPIEAGKNWNTSKEKITNPRGNFKDKREVKLEFDIIRSFATSVQFILIEYGLNKSKPDKI